MNPWLLVLIAALVLLPVALRRLHRWLLRLEECGYIYYLNKKSESGAMSSLTLLHELVEPGHRQVIEARERKIDRADAGDPPDATGI